MNRVNDWYQRISTQMQTHSNATLGDWLVLGPVMEDPSQAKYVVSRAPLFLHILGAVICMGSSAIFHLFCCHSQGASNWLSRLDYAGISAMITGSSISPVYYSYYCPANHFWRNLYITCMSVASSAVFVVSLWPKFDKPQYRVFRGVLFVTLGIMAGIPFIQLSYFM